MKEEIRKTCPFCRGLVRREAIQCRHCGTPLVAMPQPRRFCRSRSRLLAGVCGGLAVYLGLPAVVVRLAFLLMAVAGGWGAVFYLILCVAPSEPQAAQAERRLRVAAAHPWKSSRILVFAIASLCLYLPSIFLATSALFAVVWAMWAPVLVVDIFLVSWKDLGPPGWTLGVSSALLLLWLISAVLHLALRWHLGRSLLPGRISRHILIALALLAAAVSSGALVSAGYHATLDRTWRTELPDFAPEALQDKGKWRNEGIRLRDVAVRPGRGAVPSAACTVRVRSLRPEDAAAFLERTHVRWRGACLPEVQSPPLPPGLLAEASVEISLPEGCGAGEPEKARAEK